VTSVQKWAADTLDAALNLEPEEPRGYIVKPYPWAPDNAEPGKTYVSVYRTATEPAPTRGALRHELNVEVLSSHQDAAKADEALGEALSAVLDVIDTDPDFAGLTWTRAERGVIAETYPAMTIQTWCLSTDEE
jgi:hypothetical protein